MLTDMMYFKNGALYITGFQLFGFDEPILLKANKWKPIAVRMYTEYNVGEDEDEIILSSLKDLDIKLILADIFSYRNIEGVSFLNISGKYYEDTENQKNIAELIKINSAMLPKYDDGFVIII